MVVAVHGGGGGRDPLVVEPHAGIRGHGNRLESIPPDLLAYKASAPPNYILQFGSTCTNRAGRNQSQDSSERSNARTRWRARPASGAEQGSLAFPTPEEDKIEADAQHDPATPTTRTATARATNQPRRNRPQIESSTHGIGTRRERLICLRRPPGTVHAAATSQPPDAMAREARSPAPLHETAPHRAQPPPPPRRLEKSHRAHFRRSP